LPKNLVTNKQVVHNGGVEYRSSINGRVGVSPDKPGNPWWEIGPENTIVNGSGTTVGLVRRRLEATLSAGIVFGGTSSTRCSCHCPFTDGNVYWDFGGLGALRTTATGQEVNDSRETWVFSGGAQGRDIWRNGVNVATNANTSTFTAGTETFNINHLNAAGGGGDIQEFAIFCVWKRQLSAREIQDWSRTPFQVLRQNTAFYVPEAAGVNTLAFVDCPGIAEPIADIEARRVFSNVVCPAIAEPIAVCDIDYRPRPPIFTGGAGVIASVLPRRQSVSTRALRRRRRRTSRRSR
jgi:hypothetical protein